MDGAKKEGKYKHYGQMSHRCVTGEEGTSRTSVPQYTPVYCEDIFG